MRASPALAPQIRQGVCHGLPRILASRYPAAIPKTLIIPRQMTLGPGGGSLLRAM